MMAPKMWRKAALETTCLTSLLLVAVPALGQVLPQGGGFTAGGGSIVTNGSTMTVTQQGSRGIVAWNSFSIGQGGTVAFDNGAGATLNRVTGGDPSSIMGRLTATGSLYLVNPNGVVVGPTGVVATGGSFVASTHDVTNDDFLNGRALTFKGDSAATVENLGAISSTGGDVLLVAREVSNKGTISAPNGTAALAGGHEVLLTEKNDSGNGRVMVRVGPGKVDNQGTIQAAQAELKAAGGNIYALAGNNGGIVRATGSATVAGEVWLSAGDGHVQNTGGVSATNLDGSGGTVTVAAGNGRMAVNAGTMTANGSRGGKVKVSAKNVSNSGKIKADGTASTGGSVNVTYTGSYIDTSGSEVSARGVTQGGSVSVASGEAGSSLFSSGAHRADASAGIGGSINLFGSTIKLVDAVLNASGASQGGSVRVGGDYQGSGGMLKAATVTVSPTATVRADATANGGAGGRIIIWSEEKTDFLGKASARGAGAGDGGFIEASSHDTVVFAGMGDAGSDTGTAGKLLLDPKNITISDAGSGVAYFDFTDPHPASSNYFGENVVVLDNGNVVVTAPSDTFGGPNAGAVYLFNGTTGALISTLTGSQNSDNVGSGGIVKLGSGNYVIASTNWRNGTAFGAGAVTWASASSGVSGVVSSSNSLVGSHSNDAIGFDGNQVRITTLGNGNYVVLSQTWYNGTVSNAGAVTWGSGTAGVSGVVSSSNSLVGSTRWDSVGSFGIVELTNHNYIVRSAGWKGGVNGTVTAAGAVTWGSGTAGVSGVVSSSNSLVGSSATDQIGTVAVALANGHYIVGAPNWSNGGAAAVGAVTWGDGTTGITGLVSSTNSFIGSSAGDRIGEQLVALSAGAYVVASSSWKNGGASSAGAVSWDRGTAALIGVVSSSNSLVGSTANDRVGKSIKVLSDGSYIVVSTYWSNGATATAGALTWANGTTNRTGAVSSSNSLVGASTNDAVGDGGIFELGNGNYVVSSPNWNNGTTARVGAVTWIDGTAGFIGVVSAANSLIGSSPLDMLGNGGSYSPGVVKLTNGNYVVVSPSWNDGTVTGVGAVTWVNGTTGLVGVVSSSNSLVGSSENDSVGSGFFSPGVISLSNGNYVVASPLWNSGTATHAGAATWSSGTAGITGVVSSANSLVGSAIEDMVGLQNYALSNGNYVVASITWQNGTETAAGAATWGSGTAGVRGVVSSANSLVGSSANDQVGSQITRLTNGNYVVSSTYWSNGDQTSAGAVTWGSGTAGVTGVVSSTNSLVGVTAGDSIGGVVTALSTGNYVVGSRLWSNGTMPAAGAVAWVSGTTELTGTMSGLPALVGASTGMAVGGLIVDLGNDRYLARADNLSDRRLSVATPASGLTYALAPSQTITIRPSVVTDVLNTGTALTLQANNDITVDSDITVNNASGNGGALTLSAGRSILLNANIVTDNGDFTATANAKSIDGVVDGHRDTGPAGLTMAAGKSINAGTGNVVLLLDTGDGNTNHDGGSITLGGIIAATITVENKGSMAGAAPSDPDTPGDIIINTGAALTASGTGAALVLAASSGGNFTNNGDSTALSAANGRWLVYSNKSSLNTLGGLTGTAQYGTTYSGTPPGSVTGTGNKLIYSSLRELIFAAVNASITYGDALPTFTYTTDGLLDGDTISAVITGTPTVTSTALSTSGVGTYTITVSLSGVTLNNGYHYSLENTTATLTIAAKELTASGSRVYDGTTTATGVTLSGIVGSDSVSLAGTGGVTDKNVGTGKAVTGLSLTGAAAANYTLGNVTYDITAKELTGTGSRAYDGTTTVSDATLSGVVGSETVSVTGSGAITDKNVGTGKTATGLSLTGADALNYTLGTVTYAITAKELSATASRAYDGTTTASGLTLSGIVGSETVSLTGTGVVASQNIGTGKTVTGVSLTGADVSNYTLGAVTYDITAKELTATASRVYDGTATVSGLSLSGIVGSETVSLTGTGAIADGNAATGKTVTGVSLAGADMSNYTLGAVTYDITAKELTGTGTRIYDGTTSVSGATLSGIVGSETVLVTGTGTLSDKNVGTGKTASGFTLTGSDALNYMLGAVTYDITVKELTGTGSRIYDGTAGVSGATLSGVAGGDAVSVTGAGTLSDKNVGTGKTVSGFTLAGADALNYTLGAVTYAITAKGLTASGSRVYDGTTGVSGAALSGVAGGDAVSVTGAGTLSDKTVGGSKAVSGFVLAGADAGNYTLGSTLYEIIAKTLTSSGSKVYDGTTAVSGLSLSGLVSGDAVSLSGGVLSDRTAGTGKTVTGLSLTGTGASNYVLGGVTYAVTARELTWMVADVTGTMGTAPILGAALLNGLVAGDAVGAVVTAGGGAGDVIPTATMAAGTYSQRVTALTGGDAGNYVLAATGNTAGRLVIAAPPQTGGTTGGTGTTGTAGGTGTTGTALTAASPAVAAVLASVQNVVPVITTPMTTGTAGTVLGTAGSAQTGAGSFAAAGVATGGVAGTGTVRPPVSGGSTAAIGTPVVVGTAPAAAGGAVENALSVNGVTVAFRQPAAFSAAVAPAAGSGGAASVSAEGGAGAAPLAFASSFTTFSTDDGVQSTVVGESGGTRRQD